MCRWLIEAAASEDSDSSNTVELQARYQVNPVMPLGGRHVLAAMAQGM